MKDLKVGQLYDLKSFGESVHLGLDRYMGELTYVFQSEHGKHYLRSDQIVFAGCSKCLSK